MSYDYIPQTDYSGTRAERRRKEKEATRSMYKCERKLNPSQHPLKVNDLGVVKENQDAR